MDHVIHRTKIAADGTFKEDTVYVSTSMPKSLHSHALKQDNGSTDTPRTDALIERFRAEKFFDVDDALDLARQLERELGRGEDTASNSRLGEQ